LPYLCLYVAKSVLIPFPATLQLGARLLALLAAHSMWTRRLPPVACALLLQALTSLCLAGGIAWDSATLKKVHQPVGEFYCYAPALVREEEQDFIFACHNSEPGIIRDDICLIRHAAVDRKSTRSVLHAAAGQAWDNFHVCDPSPVTGAFRLRGRTFRCALFYLGNNADASINNQVGVAFSDAWEGPWHRIGDPIVAYPPIGRWGAGQPSALYDKEGQLLLFYTKGIPRTAGYVSKVNLENADAPRLGTETRLSTTGLMHRDGRSDWWNNFDVAYDPWRDRYWAVRECHPYPKDQPTQISTHLEVLSVPARDIWNPGASWTSEAQLSSGITGHERNHNACFERTATGALPSKDRIRLLFSTSRTARQLNGANPLWTYGLWEITGAILAEPEDSGNM
jgi:hypothetical protein